MKRNDISDIAVSLSQEKRGIMEDRCLSEKEKNSQLKDNSDSLRMLFELCYGNPRNKVVNDEVLLKTTSEIKPIIEKKNVSLFTKIKRKIGF
jgi:hypothetical protein